MENRGKAKQALRQKFLPYLVLKSHILELPNPELNKYIEELIESNPFVDEGDAVVYEEFETLPDNREDDLYSFLKTQIDVSPVEEEIKEVAYKIVDNLDECGFLSKDEGLLIKQLGIKKSLFKKALEFVQTLDPIGVGSRNIKEYFIIQLESEGELPDAYRKLIQDDLESLMREDYKALIKKYKISKEELFELREKLLSLDLCPGKDFKSVKFVTKFPDIIIESIGETYNAFVNKSSRRVIRLIEDYARLIDKLQDKVEKEELENLLAKAQWSIHAIEERDRLLEDIGKRIAIENSEFFNGTGDVKKISFEEFENENFDRTTLSRLIQGKYIFTPCGLFPLRYFFKHKNEKFDEDKVLKLIKEIVESEDKSNPYTDEEICDILRKEGYDIKRRTIAKYREKLNIPSSAKRKIS